MKAIRSKIKNRLKKFVELDVSGLRTHILSILLNVKQFTVDDLHEKINKQFDVSRSVVASMVGYIHSKLGILRSHKESYKTPTTYSLKEEYVDLIQNAITAREKPST
ncbi:DUF2551 domain-containing protein [Methanohalophilus mahii]|uniref:DUF2551 domain-containing protein n=1 Tax=Methanohalophilus mahii (strain ATCC 35705 / DSM 5219 / SLP) TaxID=547558 RepID=D5EBG2_METMS|nr:DUF2551 domain-containing protein [Methanohalophilus mahii]ADE36513.1 hypothetical protein Mmah_0994 [Methanohalophilus mahii DSM 5219]